MYANAYVARQIHADPDASRLMQERKLLLVRWDDFQLFNRVLGDKKVWGVHKCGLKCEAGSRLVLREGVSY